MPLAVTLYDSILALHIAAVVVAFGGVFAYPLVVGFARRQPPHLPFVHRTQQIVGQRVISPALLVIVLAGIYLASKGHFWGEFWVQWSLGAAIVLGALGGAFFGPREGRAGELAERDLGPEGNGTLSAEYQAHVRTLVLVQYLAMALVLVTIYVMAAKPFS